MFNVCLKDFDNIIFDMDGTLLDSSVEVMLCLEKAFAMENLKIDKAKLTSNIIGPPLKGIVRSVLPEINDKRLNNVVKNFRNIYDNDENDGSRLYEGIYDLLVELKNIDKKLFIATNKPTIPTQRIIRKFNLSMFNDIFTIDKFTNKLLSKSEMITIIIAEYNLKKQMTVMIGDALADINAAKENGIKSIGALWGYGDDKQPLIKNADFVVEKVNNIYLNLIEETV